MKAWFVFNRHIQSLGIVLAENEDDARMMFKGKEPIYAVVEVESTCPICHKPTTRIWRCDECG